MVATGQLGLVLTTETTVIEGEPKTWHAIHLWRVRDGHVERFEAYNQTLIEMPPG